MKYLLEQRVIQPKYQRWISKLMGYRFEIQYYPSLENKAADALSRVPPVTHLAMLTAPAFLDAKVIQNEVARDPHLVEVIAELAKDDESVPKFKLHQG